MLSRRRTRLRVQFLLFSIEPRLRPEAAMFEDATFESQGRIHTRSSNWMLATLLFNGTILLTLLLIPLLHPASLPNELRKTIITAPGEQHSAPQVVSHAASQSVTAPQPFWMPTATAPQLTRTSLNPSGPVPETPGNCCADPLGTSAGNGIV